MVISEDKIGIRFDAIAQVKSTSKFLVGSQKANWPKKRPIKDPYLEGPNAMCNATTTDEWNEARDLMNTKPRDTNGVRPMSVMMMKKQVYRHMSQELAMAMNETTT